MGGQRYRHKALVALVCLALGAGAAVRILTGAEIPAGTDTVVLQEDSEVADGRVRFRAPRKPGANSRKSGEDAEVGSFQCFQGAED